MVQLSIVQDYFLILDLVELQSVEGSCNLRVIHHLTCMLLEVSLLLLKLFHEFVLFSEEKLFASTLYELTIDAFG
jgi:hypothetical protein